MTTSGVLLTSTFTAEGRKQQVALGGVVIEDNKADVVRVRSQGNPAQLYTCYDGVIDQNCRTESRREGELELLVSISSRQCSGPRGMEASFIRQAFLPQGTAPMVTTSV